MYFTEIYLPIIREYTHGKIIVGFLKAGNAFSGLVISGLVIGGNGVSPPPPLMSLVKILDWSVETVGLLQLVISSVVAQNSDM
jgi:hypothetical protein